MLLFWGKRKNTSKYYQSRKKPRQKLFSILLILLFGLFIVNGILKQGKISDFFFSPINKEADKLNWDGKSSINVAIYGDPVLVIHISPKEEKIDFLSVPASTYTYIPGGYGWYRMSSVYDLGKLENSKLGGELFAKSAESLLAVPIDYYIKLNDLAYNDLLADKIKLYQSKFLSFGGLLYLIKMPFLAQNSVDTNLTLTDIYRLWWIGKGIRITDKNYYDTSKIILDELILPDGSRGYTPKTDELDRFSVKIFKDFNILSEGLSVSILNSTTHEGLATSVKRTLENLGVNIVSVGNYEENLFTNSVLIISKDNLKNNYTTSKLSQIFQIPIKERPEDFSSNADLTIILGDDKRDLVQ